MSNTNGYPIWCGYIITGGVYYANGTYKVTKRAVPTLTILPVGYSTGFSAAIYSGGTDVDVYQVYSTATGNNNAGYYEWKMTASAEL
jgi:hypothetical protein